MPGKWSAESDRDYYDEVESAQAPVEYDVTCISCDRHFYVRADDRPPYRCPRCAEAAIDHATQAGLAAGRRRA